MGIERELPENVIDAAGSCWSTRGDRKTCLFLVVVDVHCLEIDLGHGFCCFGVRFSVTMVR